MINYAQQVKNNLGHYFCTSIVTWRVGKDMHKCIGQVKKMNEIADLGKTKISVFFVPTTIDTTYEITNYTPQVEGVVLLATINEES